MSLNGVCFLFCVECKRKEVERIIAGQQYGTKCGTCKKMIKSLTKLHIHV